MKILVILIAAMLLLAGSAVVSAQAAPPPNLENAHYGWADVLRVDPVYSTPVETQSEQECWEEQVPAPPAAGGNDSGKRTIATVFGSIVGGLLGNRFGKGSGRVAATAAGALAGGVVGSHLADTGVDSDEPQYTTQRRCRQLGDAPAPAPAPAQPQIIGYDVEYRYRGDVYTSRLNSDPGDRVRVRISVTPVE